MSHLWERHWSLQVKCWNVFKLKNLKQKKAAENTPETLMCCQTEQHQQETNQKAKTWARNIKRKTFYCFMFSIIRPEHRQHVSVVFSVRVLKWIVRINEQIESDRFNLTRDFVLSGRTSSCTVWRREDVSSSRCSFCLQSVWTNKTRREEEEEEVKGVAAEVSVWAWSVAPTWQPWTSTDSLTPTSKCEPSYRTHKHINCLTSGQHRCSWSAATHRREMNSLYFLCSWFIKIMWTEVWYLSTHRMKTNSEPHYWRFYLQLTVMFLISDEWNRI